MNGRVLALVVVGLLWTSALAILVSGTSALEQPLPGGLPSGQLVSVLTLLFPALGAWLLSQPRSAARAFALVAVVVALLWLPLSLCLAGNLELNFSGARGTLWTALTAASTTVVLSALAFSGLSALWRLTRGRSHSQDE